MKRVKKIEKGLLDFIINAAKSSHPNEFAGVLRSEKDRISEVMVLPGTYSSERSAVMKLHTLPIASNACGSVHSHSSKRAKPSEADLNLFNKLGHVHIIIASPYNENSWSAYDKSGTEINLEVVEIESRRSLDKKFREDFPDEFFEC